jgi:D-alanyl-D-alanine carboxypeptidase
MYKMIMNKKRIFSILSLLFVMCFFAGCSSKMTRAEYHSVELKKVLQEAIKEQDAPGVSVAIKFNDDSVFSHAVGYADTKMNEALTVDHYFRVGSTTKTFTSTAILLLYQKGLLSLDNTVESILPGVMSKYGDRITVRMLLNHTSGLEDYIKSPYEDSHFFYVLIDDPTRSWEPRELIDMAVAEGLATEPGKEFLYSNTNYILLGLIIEKLTSQDIEVFFKEAIFDPLNLTETIMPVESGFPGAYSHGYFEQESDGALFDFSIQSPTGVWAAGNLISKPRDLLIWVEALLKGTLLTEDAKEQQFKFIEMEKDNKAGYGLGLLMGNGDIGHNGSVLGYQTQMFSSNGSYIIVYTNCYYQTKDNFSKLVYDKIKEIIQTP